jgi:hypothetical protein
MKYLLAAVALSTCLLAGCGSKQNAPGAPVGPPVITTPSAAGAPANPGTAGGGAGGLLKPGGV